MRTRDFWKEGLLRQSQFHIAQDLGPVGQLLWVKGEPVGVILTMRSRRGGDAARTVVNLSSWYVDDRYRLLAPRMLQQVLAEPSSTFTDLTPSPPVTAMMERFGFVRRHDGGLIIPLPLAALRPGAGGAIAGVDAADIGADARRLLDDHLTFGCLVCFLRAEGADQPLVFSTARRKGLPTARLIYATDVAAVHRNLGPIARFLLRNGAICLELPAKRDEAVFGGWFSQRSRPTFVRGDAVTAEVDHAYSEFVFLRI
ncbi:hypothetical protein ACJ4V0_02110 [Phreatobacter sp. HK31-P]